MHVETLQRSQKHIASHKYLWNVEGSMFGNGSDEISLRMYKKYYKINKWYVNQLPEIDNFI